MQVQQQAKMQSQPLLISFYFVIISVITFCEARIIVSVRRHRKILPNEKESSLEDRVYDAVPHAIAHVGERHGYATVMASPNGSLVNWDHSMVERPNILKEHSDVSSEHLQHVVETQVEHHWDLVRGLMTETSDEMEENSYPNDPPPFPERSPESENSGDPTPAVSKPSRLIIHASWSTNMTHGDGETSYKIPTTLIVIFVVLCMAIMGLVGFVVRRWWKSRGRVPIVVKTRLGCDPVVENV